MNPITLARAFREGAVHGPRGPIKAEAALLTRRSLLVFTRQSVLKLRVPGEVDGLDQSLLSVRIGLAERERAVGRRTSPHAYLDDCALSLTSESDLVLVHDVRDAEPVVATWRQPAERRADAVLLAGDATAASFFASMDMLVAFHEAAAEPRPEARFEPRAAAHWQAALSALAAVPPEVASVDERAALAATTEAWLAAMDKVLVHRATERRVRDLHGEVALEHLFLVDPPVLIDAADVATTDERFADTAEDVMRLAMELDLVAGPELSDEVVTRYALGAVDTKLALVAPFYKRLAAVRAAAEVMADATLDDRLERARAFVALALGYPL